VRGSDVVELDAAAVPVAEHVVCGVGTWESADPADAVVTLDRSGSLLAPLPG